MIAIMRVHLHGGVNSPGPYLDGDISMGGLQYGILKKIVLKWNWSKCN